MKGRDQIILAPILGQSCLVCSSLAIRTSDMAQISLKNLLADCILRNKDLLQDNMFFLPNGLHNPLDNLVAKESSCS